MIIIGELINGTRKKPKEAIAQKDADYIADLARRQAEAGADYIDVNPGTTGEAEVEDMKWLVEVAQSTTDKPLCFDSPNPAAIRAAFEVYQGSATPIINSITAEQERLETLLPLVLETGANVIALAMGDEGMPSAAGDREATARRLIDALREAGVAPERIFVDPVITPLGTGHENGQLILQAIRDVREYCPECHITGGLSNISYGLPNRRLINRVFLVLAMAAGMDSAVMDPLDEKIMAELLAAEALLGKDEWCMNYIQAERAGKLGV
ncbi:MAG: dihydropteroate synthase [Armatimonadetes bacterium]|nr:dihydropteroate synthase [Armatimonadota bacterium]